MQKSAMISFMEPESVVIVGASRKGSKDGFANAAEFMPGFGFKGKLYAINPKAEEVFGIKCYPTLRDAPEDIDLAVITLPRHRLLDAVKDCIQKGIGSIIAYAQGLADADDEGKALQAEIVKVAREGGVRILGPNTMGVVNSFADFHTVFAPIEPAEKAPIGAVAQTGLLCYASFPFTPDGKQPPLGKFVDLGNSCDIDHTDVLEYLADDDDVKVILLYIEGIGRGRRFIEVAKEATQKKPVLALKVGKGEVSARAAASHTGSMIGRDEVYDAAFRQTGIFRVEDVDEMQDLTKAFLALPLMKGGRVAIFSHIGSLCSMGSTACEKYGLELANLSPETTSMLKEFYPPWMPVRNPVDFWMAATAHGYQNMYEKGLEAIYADDNVDGILCSMFAAPYPAKDMYNIFDIVEKVTNKSGDKPIVVFCYGPSSLIWKGVMEQKGITQVYTSADIAIRTLAALWKYYRHTHPE